MADEIINYRANTDRAFDELDASLVHILEVPVGEVQPYIPVIREKGDIAERTARAEILDLDARHDAFREENATLRVENERLKGEMNSQPAWPTQPPIEPPEVVVKRKLTSYAIDTGFDIKKLPFTAQLAAQVGINTVMQHASAKSWEEGYTVLAFEGNKEVVGRGLDYPMQGMGNFLRFTGAPFVPAEAYRILKILRAGYKDTNKDGFLNLLYDVEKDTSEKEDNLGYKLITTLTRILFENRKHNKDWAEMADWWIDALLKNVSAKWMKWKGKIWPQSYILHPALAAIQSMHDMYLMTGDKRFAEARDAYAKLVIKEFVYVTVGGRELVLFGYNERTTSPNPKPLKAFEQCHMSVYSWKDFQNIVGLAYDGVTPFNDLRLLKALAVTNELGLLNGPYEVKDKKGNVIKTAVSNKDVFGAFHLALQEGTEQKDANGRVFDGRGFKDCWWDQGKFFRSGQSVIGFPGAAILPFETEGKLLKTYQEYTGTPEKVKARSSMVVHNWFYYAINAMYRDGGYSL